MNGVTDKSEEKARKIIYKDDFFKQYADIVPEVGERLETYVFEIASALDEAALNKVKGKQ